MKLGLMFVAWGLIIGIKRLKRNEHKCFMSFLMVFQVASTAKRNNTHTFNQPFRFIIITHLNYARYVTDLYTQLV